MDKQATVVLIGHLLRDLHRKSRAKQHRPEDARFSLRDGPWNQGLCHRVKAIDGCPSRAGISKK
jgi:hypothetical protein